MEKPDLRSNDAECNDVNEDSCDITDGGSVHTSDCCLSSSSEVAKEQRYDPSLTGWWKVAKRVVLYLLWKIICCSIVQRFWARMSAKLLCLRAAGLVFWKWGTTLLFGTWDLTFKRTKARISYTFYWPDLGKTVCSMWKKSLLSLQAILRQRKQSTEAQPANRFWFCRCMVSVGWRLGFLILTADRLSRG